MFCEKCGREINENAKFCTYCGQKVGAPTMLAPGNVPGGGGISAGQSVSGDGGIPADQSVSGDGGIPADQNVPQNAEKPNRKWTGWLIVAAVLAAVVVVGVVVIVCVKPFGADKAETDETEELREEKASDRKEKKSDDVDEDGRSEDDSDRNAEKPADDDLEEEAAEPEEASEEEILEVLSAYQDYVDVHNDGALRGFMLAYLDEDNIPEMIAIGDYEAAGQMIITYQDGELTENYVGRLGGLSYVEKQNFYRNSNGHMGYYYDDFYCLENGEQVLIAGGEYGDKYDEEGNIVWNEEGDYPEQVYAWEGEECSEEEYYDMIDLFIKTSVGDAVFTEVDTYQGGMYFNMLEAYQALKTKSYSAFWPEMEEFDLKNGILTFTVSDGAYYGWGGTQEDSEILYTVSYPVAPDCIWENRIVGSGENYQPQVGNTEYLQDTTYEEIRDWLDSEKEFYEEMVATYGKEEAEVSSPFNTVVVVEDGVVVRVYTVIS